MMIVTTLRSPLGELSLYADPDANAIVGIALPAQPARDATRGSCDALARACTQLAEYFAGARVAFDLPLAPVGTAFQRRV